MRLLKTRNLCLLLVIIIITCIPEFSAAAQDETFTYQGRLDDGGTPADGLYDFEFALWSCSTPYMCPQVGSTIHLFDVQVNNGLFTVELNFGPGIFIGNSRWLQIRVGPAGGTITSLSPTQLLTSVPYAVNALSIVETSITSGTYGSSTEVPQFTVQDDGRLVSASNVSIDTDDADADPANELNTNFYLNGSVLELTDAGGTLSQDLSSLTDDDWAWSSGSGLSGDLYHTGNVSIGTDQSINGLYLYGGDLRIDDSMPFITLNGTGNSGLKFEVDGDYGGYIYRDASDNALILSAKSSAVDLYDLVLADDGKIGINTLATTSLFEIEGDSTSSNPVVDVDVTYSGTYDVRGIDSYSVPVSGYGIGVYGRGGFRGVQGFGDGGDATGSSVGVYGSATGTDGYRYGVHGVGSGTGTVNYGIYGAAYNATTNWAGYFSSGHVYISNELRIGTEALDGHAGYKVAIDGKVICEELRVMDPALWPDYVFEKNYDLMPLEQLETTITQEKRLPGIPSAVDVDKEGIGVGEMQARLLQKIEELTLYVIKQSKDIDQLKKENEQLKALILGSE